MSFIEIGVHPEVARGLAELGFESPTPVQEKVIPLLLGEEGDWISLAQTGTGKTAAFGIPLIQKSDTGSRKTQALVLCPTRELCVQVARDIESFGKYIPKLKVLAVYGGARMDTQINALRRGVHIIVATPGRLQDLMNRGAADISAIRTVVLDEADEMLNMGFQEEISSILADTPAQKSTLLFSATMSREVKAIAGRYMTDPREIIIGTRNSGAENVQHHYYMVQARDRFPALKRIVDLHPDIYGIIFCRTRQETQDVADRLARDGYQADALHGELSQAQRDLVMGRFRRKTLQLLVATDVAARGVDVNDLTHVINYNLPDDLASYTHRSGRTGRAGKTGISISIIHQREGWRVKTIERNIKKTFKRCRVPTGREICDKQIMHRIDTLLKENMEHDHIDHLLPALRKKLASFDREELIRRFVALESKRFIEFYRFAPDLNVEEKKAAHGRKNGGDSSRRNDRRGARFTRFHINVGKNDGMAPERLISIINQGSRNTNIAVGKIQLMRNFCFIEADSKFSNKVMSVFSRQMINGKKVNIEIAENRSEFSGKRGTRRPKAKRSNAGGRWKKGKRTS
jgi:ATP-dependent RNA helicase DeaD